MEHQAQSRVKKLQGLGSRGTRRSRKVTNAADLQIHIARQLAITYKKWRFGLEKLLLIYRNNV